VVLANCLSRLPNLAQQCILNSEVTGALLMSENEFEGKISVSALPAGVYLLQIQTDKGLVVSRFVKE